MYILARLTLAVALLLSPIPILQPGASATEMETQSIDWCALFRAESFSKYGRQRTLGECAHKQFEKLYNGNKIKYTRNGISVVPDGVTSNGKVLLELKPNGTAARQAAKKTASVSGIKTLAYRWVYNSATKKFTFINTTNEGQGVSPQGKNASRIYRTGPRLGNGVPIAKGGLASGYRVKAEDDADPDADVTFTEVEQFLLADWTEYTDEEYDAMGSEIGYPNPFADEHIADAVVCDTNGACVSDTNGARLADLYFLDGETNSYVEVDLVHP